MTQLWFVKYWIELLKVLLVMVGVLEFQMKRKAIWFSLLGFAILAICFFVFQSVFGQKMIQTYSLGFYIIFICAWMLIGKWRLFFAFFSFTCIALVETSLIFIVGTFLHMDFQEIVRSHSLSLYSNMSIVLILFIIWIKKRFHISVASAVRSFQWEFVGIGLLSILSICIYMATMQYIDVGDFDGIRKVLFIFGVNVVGISFVLMLVTLWLHVYAKKKIAFLLSENQKLEKQRNEYDQLKQANEKEVKKVLHDVKKHLYVLQSFSEKKDYEGLDNYLKEIQPVVYALDMDFFTGHKITDIVANEMRQKCEKEKIDFRWEGIFPAKCVISNLELCVIFSNLLDNAFEACNRMEDTVNKWINVQIKRTENHLLVSIRNSTNHIRFTHEITLQTSKTDNENHGFGFINVQEAIQKYNGQLHYSIEDDVFSVEWMLPNLLYDEETIL